jgi:hypothetical protein
MIERARDYGDQIVLLRKPPQPVAQCDQLAGPAQLVATVTAG